MAFPEVPWVFVYRDTVEIMQSHWKGRETTTTALTTLNSRGNSPVCARNYQTSPEHQPATTLQVIKDARKSVKDLNKVEYCAAHLAGLSLSAIHEYDRTSQSSSGRDNDNDHGNGHDNSHGHGCGRFVDYHQMPEIVWNEILPHHFGVNPLPTTAIANMEKTAFVYSKGRGEKANQEWNEDSSKKQQSATPEVTRAANEFAGSVYERMTELSSSASSKEKSSSSSSSLYCTSKE